MRDTPPGPAGQGVADPTRRAPAPPAYRLAGQAARSLASRSREVLAAGFQAARGAAPASPVPPGAADQMPPASPTSPAPTASTGFPRLASQGPLPLDASESAASTDGERVRESTRSTPRAEAGRTLRDRLAEGCERFTGRFGEVWWIGSGEPITLSLPRGATVLVVTGVVGIIVMAFAVGRRTGPGPSMLVDAAATGSASVAQVASGHRVSPDEGVPGGAEWPGAIEPVRGETTDAGRLQARFDAGMDPRVDGLNYLVYMTATRRECMRLAEFLHEHDVRAIVMQSSRSVHSAGPDGERIELPLYWVVDVGEGFSRNQYLRGEHESFRDERMELGRAWKRHNGDRGSDLSDMQFYAYSASRR